MLLRIKCGYCTRVMLQFNADSPPSKSACVEVVHLHREECDDFQAYANAAVSNFHVPDTLEGAF